MEIPEYLPKKWILIRDKFNRDRAGSMYQTIKSVLKSVLHRVCPSLLPPLQKGVRGFRRLIRDDAWLILPAVLPEDMEWLQRLEALATAPPKVKAEQEGGGRHLVLVIDTLGAGGAERQLCLLALELSRRGYRVTLLCIGSLEGDNGHYLPLLENSAVTVLTPQSIFLSSDTLLPEVGDIPDVAWRIIAALDELHPDRIISYMDCANVWCGVYALLQNKKQNILSFRSKNPSIKYYNISYCYDYYKILIRSPLFLLNANAQSNADDYAAWLGINPDRICIAHNAVYLPEISSTTRSKTRRLLGVADDARVVLGVFRWAVEKNPMLFLDVAETVHKTLPDVLFLHAGIGVDREAVERESRKRGMTGWLRLLGRRDDVADLMQAADVLLLCSHIEGLPNVLLEAQAAGLPVVATKVGGVPEAVLEGESALLAEGGDRATLAHHCVELLRDPQRRARMGQAGRRFVRANFTSEALGDKILDQLELPRTLPEPAAPMPTPHTGIPLETRYAQLQLERFLKKAPLADPLLIFAHFPLTPSIVSLLSARSLCLTLPGVSQPEMCPTHCLDWRNPESHAEFAGPMPPGACALMLGEWPQWQNLERILQHLGVSWIAYHNDRGWHRFPVVRLWILRDVRGLVRGVKKRLGRHFLKKG